MRNSAPQLAGYFDSPFWQRTVLQAARNEPAVRYAVAGIGALHEKLLTGAVSPEQCQDQRTRFALEQCNKSIHALLKTPVSSQVYWLRRVSRPAMHIPLAVSALCSHKTPTCRFGAARLNHSLTCFCDLTESRRETRLTVDAYNMRSLHMLRSFTRPLRAGDHTCNSGLHPSTTICHGESQTICVRARSKESRPRKDATRLHLAQYFTSHTPHITPTWLAHLLRRRCLLRCAV